MVSTPLLLLSLAFAGLVIVVNGDNVVSHSESSEANVHPHSFTRHTLPSRTLLNTEEAGPEGVSGFNPVDSWANLFPPATPFLPDQLFGAGPPINQEDEEGEGDVDMLNAGYYESHVGSKRNNGPSKSNQRERHFRGYQQQQHRGMFGQGGSGSHAWASNDLKRERSSVPTLSVESSLDLIRQKFIQELRRRQMIEKQKQIESNGDLLSSIGKRSGLQSSMTKH